MMVFSPRSTALGGAVVASVVDLIGNTPLVRLPADLAGTDRVEIWAKLEGENPGGSVKDRAAKFMIEAAERDGILGPGKVLIEATSGNTGIAMAMIGAAKGYPVELCMPSNASEERKRTLAALGATVHLTDPLQSTDGAIEEVRRLAAAHPGRYAYLDQYSNPANPLAHETTTGVEIWEQTGGRITHFVAGLGTTGTLVGTSRRLKQFNPRVEVVAVQPDIQMHAIEGLKHMQTAVHIPSIYDAAAHDRVAVVSTEESFEAARTLAARGLFVGPSAGAAFAAARTVAGGLTAGVVVCLFPDGGERYLSTALFGGTDDAV